MPSHKAWFIVISVLIKSPTTRYSISEKDGCLVRLPANSKRVPILFSSKYLIRSERRKTELSLIVIGKPNHEGLEFLVDSVNSI